MKKILITIMMLAATVSAETYKAGGTVEYGELSTDGTVDFGEMSIGTNVYYNLPTFHVCEIKTNVTWSVEFGTDGTIYVREDPTNRHIEAAAKAGDICKVFGHWWEMVPHYTLEYRTGGYPQHRKCRLCELRQTKQPATWEDDGDE